MRAYAAHRKELQLAGRTHQAVMKAIRDGRLSQSVERRGRRWLIDPELADREWERNTNALQARDSEVVAAARSAAARAAKEAEDAQPSLFGELGKLDAPRGPRPTQPDPDNDDTSVARTSRLQNYFKAELLRIQLAKESGELVSAVEVRRELTTAWRLTRDAFLAMPERMADDLAAIDDPHEVRELLTTEASRVLEELAGALERG